MWRCVLPQGEHGLPLSPAGAPPTVATKRDSCDAGGTTTSGSGGGRASAAGAACGGGCARGERCAEPLESVSVGVRSVVLSGRDSEGRGSS
ncbi:hypothetical protein STCU_10435 [Strigomonas culicis]|uniref:Uncharacterized protein n=1 Tax=Strigomonas culicis TaxID=28005 RepID=S9TI47_9TRYP|nr:hypothetical protein STCU_10435 [Strigomonas culicis]|eukprot:EPY17742.1 hypothetical protein STCU_10435 [Strigomonas culicis]